MKQFTLIVIALNLCMSVFSFGQQEKKLSWNDQFIMEKKEKPYPERDSFVTLNQKNYNFNKKNRPAFVYISSESCLPCKYELPLYIEACKQYPQFDFVYFDTDLDGVDTAVIIKKFGDDLNLPNLYVMYEPYAYFYDRHLFYGFPTKYFVGSDGIVKDVQLGGWMDKVKVLAEWQPVLSKLQ
ncbi:thioredoxin family protein [Taibaiella lutea]|uniref:Thioredoxin family protein n=1 Tax=Taibaiella lutea TaxID=2608001 RepID=A0A5M6CNZ3_9BACT|nr:thioredoxin family protein [Taibaiella lutea]KAA5536864.1 thioredoxin family protein [Taibaiella lutea]